MSRPPRGAALLFAALCAAWSGRAVAQESRPADEDAPALTEAALKAADKERFDEALELLEKARKARPDETVTTTNLARMLGRRALHRAKAERFADAEEDLVRAIGLAPSERYLRVVRAGLWRERGDVYRAESEVARVLVEDPALAYGFEELARCKYEDDDLAAALDALETAKKLDPERAPKLAAFEDRLRREYEAEKEFDRVVRGSFAVKFDGKDFRGAADSVLDLLDAAERRARDFLGHVPRRTTSVVLYTRKDFSAVTGAHAWTGGLFDGKIRLPVRNFAATRDEVAKTLTHEFMHLVVRDLTKRCPTWLNEGLAQLAEGKRAADVAAFLRGRELKRAAALPNDWFGVASGGEVSVYYAQGLSFTAFLLEDRGPGALKDLLEKLDAATPFAKAFEDVYGRTLDEAEDRWRETLR